MVSEENLKVQVSALRKALGADRDVIRTEFGGGYRFSRMLCVNGARTPVNLPCDKKALVWPNSVSTELSAIAPV